MVIIIRIVLFLPNIILRQFIAVGCSLYPIDVLLSIIYVCVLMAVFFVIVLSLWSVIVCRLCRPFGHIVRVLSSSVWLSIWSSRCLLFVFVCFLPFVTLYALFVVASVPSSSVFVSLLSFFVSFTALCWMSFVVCLFASFPLSSTPCRNQPKGLEQWRTCFLIFRRGGIEVRLGQFHDFLIDADL